MVGKRRNLKVVPDTPIVEIIRPFQEFAALQSSGGIVLLLCTVAALVWANSAWGGYWRWDPKETGALVVWFLYAALLHGRLTIGWRGRRAAIFAILGFICLLFTFLGVNLLLGGQHTFKSFTGQ